jgi:hypothetical protein
VANLIGLHEKQAGANVMHVLRSGARTVAVIGALAATTALVAMPVPVAAADAHASCIGIEASEISPPGSSDEFPGGMPQVAREVRLAADALGVAPGAIYSFVAQLHAGSHEACDAATG